MDRPTVRFAALTAACESTLQSAGFRRGARSTTVRERGGPMGLEVRLRTKAVPAAPRRRARPRLKRLSVLSRAIGECFTS